MKRKKLLILLGSICLTLMVAVACAAPTPTPTLTPTPTPTPSPSPPPTEEVFQWRAQMINSPAETIWGHLMLFFCEEVEKASGGRLVITPYAGGTLSPNADVLKSVASGLFEIGVTDTSYHVGFMPEMNISTSPFMLRGIKEAMHIYQFYGMLDFFREGYAENGVYLLGLGHGHTRPLLSRVPVNRVSDFEGLKVRTVGSLATMCDALGAATTYIPGGETYTAFATGTIDAATWGAEGTFVEMKWHEVAKYLIYPALLDPAFCSRDLFVDMEAWNSLPEDLQNILTLAASAVGTRDHESGNYATFELRADLDKAGVTRLYLPEEDNLVLAKAAEGVWTELADKSPRTYDIVKIITDFMRTQGHTDYKLN